VQVCNLHKNTADAGFPQVENLRPLQKPAATSETHGHLSEVGAGLQPAQETQPPRQT
jgi:hypothetical protein